MNVVCEKWRVVISIVKQSKSADTFPRYVTFVIHLKFELKTVESNDRKKCRVNDFWPPG
jgi:hypothetical protein